MEYTESSINWFERGFTQRRKDSAKAQRVLKSSGASAESLRLCVKLPLPASLSCLGGLDFSFGLPLVFEHTHD